MDKTTELQIVSLGDYAADLDNIVSFEVMKGDKLVRVPVRIMTPLAEDDHALLELITDEFGDEMEELAKYETDDLISTSPDHRRKMLRFSLLNSSCLMSSSCFKVELEQDAEGNTVISADQPPVPEKFWVDGPTCLKTCPRPLFQAIKVHLEAEGLGKQVSEVEAGK
jgi:hypothetical protein